MVYYTVLEAWLALLYRTALSSKGKKHIRKICDGIAAWLIGLGNLHLHSFCQKTDQSPFSE